MKKTFLSLLAAAFILSITPLYAGECVDLGWVGGAAGSGAKWTKADIDIRGQIVTIKYNWKNGSMTGRVQSDGSLKGTWIQDGSDGGQFQFKVPKGAEAMGWWSSNADGNKKRYPMKVKLCK
ncbi:MAG TPA: hypothetical protein PLX41_12250 [Bacteroidales bacterium]|nr:hypothetical protein [Bacteroidales bacterium]